MISDPNEYWGVLWVRLLGRMGGGRVGIRGGKGSGGWGRDAEKARLSGLMLADVAEAVGVTVVARVHARPAREFALQRLELARHLEHGHARHDIADEILREPDLDLQRERLGPGQLGLDALDLVFPGESASLAADFTAWSNRPR